MTKKRKIQMLLLAIVLSISCFLTCFAPMTIKSVYASNIDIQGGYTGVMDDLQKDATFNPENYPLKQNDYSLQLITIAESVDKELFVYVYQPCSPNADLKAVSINISTTSKGLNYKNYRLNLVSQQGCFGKYIVNNFIVSSELTRYYEITSIYRSWNAKYDMSVENENGNIINEVNYDVAKQYILTTSENGIEVFAKDIETIRIVDKYVGFVRYEDGKYSSSWGSAWGTYLAPGMDSHFVAFTTDKKIDLLMEADVYYQSQTYNYLNTYTSILNKGDGTDTWGGIEDKYSYITYTQRVDGVAGAKYNYKFNRIQTVAEFEQTENYEYVRSGILFNQKTEVKLTEEGKQNIRGMKWVLRFAETSYANYTSTNGTSLTGGVRIYEDHIDKTLVSNVSILRLKFETDGVVYNLGVLDNKQTGDGIPDNYTKTTWELKDFAKILFGLILLILVVVVLAPILPTIFNVIWLVAKTIFKVLWWIITAPFKLIKAIFKKRE